MQAASMAPSNTVMNDASFKPGTTQQQLPAACTGSGPEYINRWQSALSALYKSQQQQQQQQGGLPQPAGAFAAFPAAAAMATPQAFSTVQNLWAAQNGQGNVANVLPVAMQLAANGDALALAQAQALQQQVQGAAAGVSGKAKIRGCGPMPGDPQHRALDAAKQGDLAVGVSVVKSEADLANGHGCHDERELKKQRRKQSNRESARRSRLRKQAECEELSERVKKLSDENHVLQTALEQMKHKCEDLTSQNKRLQQELHTFAQGQTKTAAASGKDDSAKVATQGDAKRVKVSAGGDEGKEEGGEKSKGEYTE